MSNVDGETADCVCVNSCLGDGTDGGPVCGTDGRDYFAVCNMRWLACENKTVIEKKYEGLCGNYVTCIS